jgi:hypothetical protein
VLRPKAKIGSKFDDINNLTGEVIGAAIEVHKALGPGLLENIYEKCLCKELELWIIYLIGEKLETN